MDSQLQNCIPKKVYTQFVDFVEFSGEAVTAPKAAWQSGSEVREVYRQSCLFRLLVEVHTCVVHLEVLVHEGARD